MVVHNQLKLIDLDDISYGSEVSPRRRIKNFQQVYNTLPKATPQAVKLRLLAHYKQYTNTSRKTIRTMANAIDLTEE
jgi:hypothetical protein